MVKKTIFLLIFWVLIGEIVFSQTKQHNSPGSDYLVDVPYRIELASDSILPISFYFHDNDCFGCSGDLAFINIQLKNASSTTFSPIISFSSLADADFLSLFTTKSSTDINWGNQSFDESLPKKSNSKTIIFAADTNWGIPSTPNVPLVGKYFYFNFNLSKAIWETYLGSNGVFDIKVTLGIDYEVDQYFYFRVFTSNFSYPKVQNWYRGDTHYHSFFTQNTAENGLPISQVKNAAKLLGLDWVTFTDHSCDFDNYGSSMQDNWEKLGELIQSQNQIDSSLILIRGIEMSVKNSAGKIVHALTYPNPSDVFSMPYIGDGGGDNFSTAVTINIMLDSIQKYNGFCYTAHPYAEYDKLPIAVNGGCWNYSQLDFPLNGSPHPSLGTVICNDTAYSSDVLDMSDSLLIKNSILGGQLWNNWNALYTNSNIVSNPYNVMNTSSSSLTQLLATNPEQHIYRFGQNMDVYKAILKKGLIAKNQNAQIKNWKHFFIGGSDAHGSFNYSTTDMFGSVTGNITNNALGKITTITYCPNGMGQNGENVLYALKNGNSVLSSGPIAIPEIQKNNQVIGIPGNDFTLNMSELSSINLNIELVNSPEFGIPNSLKVIVGTENGEYIKDISSFDSEQQFNLLDIITEIIPNNSEYLNKYFYIRIEFSTLNTYNSENIPIHRSEFDVYSSFSNPIWMKIEDNTSSKQISFKNEIRISPNPASTKLFIKSNKIDPASQLRILSVDGRLISGDVRFSGSNMELNIENLAKGVYILQIQKKSGVENLKFIKE